MLLALDSSNSFLNLATSDFTLETTTVSKIVVAFCLNSSESSSPFNNASTSCETSTAISSSSASSATTSSSAST